mmetsp:Transcript_13632/g.48117  ORF Transcript_13632/g.48117 Transcript_13632/m.48117 type:complete len:425 (+) Transcript_13632:82-1356(+)
MEKVHGGAAAAVGGGGSSGSTCMGAGAGEEQREWMLRAWWEQAVGHLGPESRAELARVLHRLVAKKREGLAASEVFGRAVLTALAMLLCEVEFPGEGNERVRLGFLAGFECSLPPSMRPSWRGMAVVAVRGEAALRQELRRTVSDRNWIGGSAYAAPDLPPVPEAVFPRPCTTAMLPSKWKSTRRRAIVERHQQRLTSGIVRTVGRAPSGLAPNLSCDWHTQEEEEEHEGELGGAAAPEAPGACQGQPREPSVSVGPLLEVRAPSGPGEARALLRGELSRRIFAARSCLSLLKRSRLKPGDQPLLKRRRRTSAAFAQPGPPVFSQPWPLSPPSPPSPPSPALTGGDGSLVGSGGLHDSMPCSVCQRPLIESEAAASAYGKLGPGLCEPCGRATSPGMWAIAGECLRLGDTAGLRPGGTAALGAP